MFESAEIGRKLSKDEYRERVPELRRELVQLQFALRNRDFPVILVIGGDDRIGADEVLSRLSEWIDPRYLRVAAFAEPSDEERERPLFWRYWRCLPRRGRIGIFLNEWTMHAIREQLDSGGDELQMERRARHITRFEKALADDGALVLKFWIHLPKGQHRKRLQAASKDPEKLWQVNDQDRRIYEEYDDARPIVSEILRRTSAGPGVWEMVEGTSSRYRDVAIAERIRDALRERLARPEATTPGAPEATEGEAHTVLDAVDLSRRLDEDDYKKQLDRQQARLAELTRKAFDRGVSTVAVFQGWDAAGKGGAIRRATAAIPPAAGRVVPIGEPNEEEKSYHYLWRFWRRLPRAGRVVIFDRSWYERVLTERVEGFAKPEEWQRAYDEINDFEEQLCLHGIVLLKFWLHIDRDEQLERFQSRANDPARSYKLTPDDWRNRERWDDYARAVDEMAARTQTAYAPWHLVPANDKKFARIHVLKTFCKALEAAL